MTDETENSLPAGTAAPSDDRNEEGKAEREPLTRAEEILSGMTAEEKVGQLFVIRPESLEPSLTPDQANDDYAYGVTGVSEAMAAFLREHPAGGVIFFGKNLTDPEALHAFMDALDGASDVPLLFAVDEEGGIVSRVSGSYAFGVEDVGPMGYIGASGDPARAEAAGAYIGNYLRDFGFHLDLAPVADVNSNPYNVVIGIRAFGSDPAVVSAMAGAFLSGLHGENVAGCLKHFPGHGDVTGDTHTGAVAVTKTWDELREAELIPFIDNFDKTDLVMVAHLTLPEITSDGLPASLSRELVTDRLRGELGYTGLVITDSLAMDAVAARYGAGEAALLAFEAGVDILLMPRDYEAAYAAVLDAVKSGEIVTERLDESVLRILQLKENLGLLG